MLKKRTTNVPKKYYTPGSKYFVDTAAIKFGSLRHVLIFERKAAFFFLNKDKSKLALNTVWTLIMW